MTERLYYTDAYQVEFRATVTRVEHDHGDLLVELDRTAFYPTSGGQPFDTGRLDDNEVAEVFEDADGAILHRLTGSPSLGSEVHGRVDWNRRFDHMQHHTGQHLLSAAVQECCGARTVGFHLGRTACTIDLDRELSGGTVARVEAAANRLIWDNRSVTIRFLDADATRDSLRKPSVRRGTLRVIEIEGVDRSACGGTHVDRTGAIGSLVVSGTERSKGGTRLEFVCGTRAMMLWRTDRQRLSTVARRLSVGVGDVPIALAKLQDELRVQRQAIRRLTDRLMPHEAARLLARGRRHGARTVVVDVVDFAADSLPRLASAIVEGAGRVAVLFTRESPASVVVARSTDVELDAAGVVRRLCERLGGRGGGRSTLAQGGGLQRDASEQVAVAAQLLATPAGVDDSGGSAS